MQWETLHLLQEVGAEAGGGGGEGNYGSEVSQVVNYR